MVNKDKFMKKVNFLYLLQIITNTGGAQILNLDSQILQAKQTLVGGKKVLTLVPSSSQVVTTNSEVHIVFFIKLISYCYKFFRDF